MPLPISRRRRGADPLSRAAPPVGRGPGLRLSGRVGNWCLRRSETLIAAAVVTVLVCFASGYGYHRDELYFLAAGRHPAFAYADQGPLTPLLASAMSTLDAGSLRVLRLPSALAASATVLLTARMAGELNGGRRERRLAAIVAAASALVLFTGHTLSTSTFDLLAWSALCWLMLRAVATGRGRWWLLVGLVLGVSLLNKPLPAFLAAAAVIGIAIAGPRRLLRNGWLWCAAAIAVLLWSPWLVWQTSHGWPQLAVSRSVAAGRSTSSQPWWTVVPFQALLAGPALAPVWIAGLVRVFRDPRLRGVRFLGWAWALLAVAFMATGGKPYYLAGMLPFLIAAGATPAMAWIDRGRAPKRQILVGGLVALSALVAMVIALPALPPRDAGPVVALNPDVGETIGWPDLARAVARVLDQRPALRQAVIFTANYGEAGAIDRYGPGLGLPRAYSGHNAYGSWGPPPDGAAPVVTVGLTPQTLAHQFRGCAVLAHVDNAAGIDNDEHGAAIAVCRGPRLAWSHEWSELKHLG